VQPPRSQHPPPCAPSSDESTCQLQTAFDGDAIPHRHFRTGQHPVQFGQAYHVGCAHRHIRRRQNVLDERGNPPSATGALPSDGRPISLRMIRSGERSQEVCRTHSRNTIFRTGRLLAVSAAVTSSALPGRPPHPSWRMMERTSDDSWCRVSESPMKKVSTGRIVPPTAALRKIIFRLEQ
jgi:hypothetical protein